MSTSEQRRERYAKVLHEFDPEANGPFVLTQYLAAAADAVIEVADAEQATLLYPLSQHTPESARALAEDIGASEDSLLVAWIRAEAKAARVEALHVKVFTSVSDEVYGNNPACACGHHWPCETRAALEGP